MQRSMFKPYVQETNLFLCHHALHISIVCPKLIAPLSDVGFCLLFIIGCIQPESHAFQERLMPWIGKSLHHVQKHEEIFSILFKLVIIYFGILVASSMCHGQLASSPGLQPRAGEFLQHYDCASKSNINEREFFKSLKIKSLHYFDKYCS